MPLKYNFKKRSENPSLAPALQDLAVLAKQITTLEQLARLTGLTDTQVTDFVALDVHMQKGSGMYATRSVGDIIRCIVVAHYLREGNTKARSDLRIYEDHELSKVYGDLIVEWWKANAAAQAQAKQVRAQESHTPPPPELVTEINTALSVIASTIYKHEQLAEFFDINESLVTALAGKKHKLLMRKAKHEPRQLIDMLRTIIYLKLRDKGFTYGVAPTINRHKDNLWGEYSDLIEEWWNENPQVQARAAEIAAQRDAAQEP